MEATLGRSLSPVNCHLIVWAKSPLPMTVFETQPLEITDGLKNCLKTMPLNFTITLNQLPPGDYTCQVTVLDPTGQKSNILAGSSRTCPVTSHPALSLPVTLHLRRSRSWKPGNS
jgi:hypothetical protein